MIVRLVMLKTLYYMRLRQMALEGTEVEGCVSCML